MKRIAVLGSTGSIGQQALAIVRAHPRELEVVGLAAGRNLELLERQIDEFKSALVCSSVDLGNGHAGERLSMEEMVSHPDVNFVIVATSGKAGLSPTLAALRAGKTVALASKEVLVMAGEIVMREAGLRQVQIIPLDSEHSAIWQCLQGEESRPHRLILTASGGPFYRYSRSQISGVTRERALRHPVWKMGRKVTIDSATLMNKGLEVIEAHWLFSIPFDSISVLIHPQSIIHSMVEFADGSLKAQLGPPDMRLPIQYALSYPERWSNTELPRLDWSNTRDLSFEAVDDDRFPSLKTAVDAGKSGGTYPAVLCAADEVAIELFLSHRIGFTDIVGVVQGALEHHQCVDDPSLEDILAADTWAREYAMRFCSGDGESPDQRSSIEGGRTR